MKKLFFFLCLCGLIVSARANSYGRNVGDNSGSSTGASSSDTIVIGKIVNGGNPTFTADTNELKKDWQSFINNQDTPSWILTKIVIVSNSGNYYLVASSTQGGKTLHTTIALKNMGTCLFVSGMTTTCTTINGSSDPGCMPQGTSCTPCTNGGKCKKTVSSSPVSIFPHASVGGCSAE